MPHAFEAPLSQLRQELLLMASLTERNFSLAIRAYIERSDTLAETVEIEDSQIDALELQIDEMIIAYMATRGPVASDCRLLMCASHVVSDLERIGDEATTIARSVVRLNRAPELAAFPDILVMAETAQEMLRDAIGLLIEGNADPAPEIIARDKSVDEMLKGLTRDLADLMRTDPGTVDRGLLLNRMGRAIERVADHAANIAEEVFYLFKARDIRHGAGENG